MAWENLKDSIAEVIKVNGNNEITGQVLQNTLTSIVSAVGENAAFAGLATTATSPGSPDGPVFYIAGAYGTFTNFGGLIAQFGYLNIFKNNSSGSWELLQIPIGTGKSYISGGTSKGEIFNDYDNNIASGANSHAEGLTTQAAGNGSHSEGQATKAFGHNSHAGGVYAEARGDNSFAHGKHVIVKNIAECAFGQYNFSAASYMPECNTVFTVGIGEDLNNKNAVAITQSGDIYFYGIGNYAGRSVDKATPLQKIAGFISIAQTVLDSLIGIDKNIEDYIPFDWINAILQGYCSKIQVKNGDNTQMAQIVGAVWNNRDDSAIFAIQLTQLKAKQIVRYIFESANILGKKWNISKEITAYTTL